MYHKLSTKSCINRVTRVDIDECLVYENIWFIRKDKYFVNYINNFIISTYDSVGYLASLLGNKLKILYWSLNFFSGP